MTFSICVREPYTVDGDDGGDAPTQYRFGVAVTTRLPAVGVLCPFANGHGAVATQSHVNVALGRRGIDYLADGLAVEDALDALLAGDDGAPERQLHGVDREDSYVFSGDDCKPWYGHETGENYTVAGNLLTGESVLTATAEAYEADRITGTPDGSAGHEAPAADPLAARLVEALAAGHAEGGDKREELRVQSAALVVSTSEATAPPDLPLYSDLRVDATETPIADLRATVADAMHVQETVDEEEASSE